MKALTVFLIALNFSLCAYAQISLPDKIEPYEPIVAGCDCVIPKDGVLQFMWSVDPASKSFPCDGDKKLFIWTPPGEHWVEVLVVTKTYKSLQVWVPDPNHPSDINKAKLETIKVIDTFDVQRFKKTYAVGTPGPGPAPGPTPPGPSPGPGPVPPGPAPTNPFAAEVQKWLKALPATSYSRDKALKIANTYQAVAAQAVATSGMDLQAFVSKSKEMNNQVITDPADLQAWGTNFFNPLAQKQASLFSERKLDTKDTAGIATLWRETAEAITQAAF